MASVASPIMTAEMIIAGLRPNLSPTWPKTAPPSGRGGSWPMAKTPKAASSEATWIVGGEEDFAENGGEEAIDSEVVPFEKAANRAGQAEPAPDREVEGSMRWRRGNRHGDPSLLA